MTSSSSSSSPPPPSGMICADVMDGLRTIPSESVDLVMTSPPYADARAKQYGGPPPDEYVSWYMPIARELRRVLRPAGSYILNLKEGLVDGQRSLYVYDLVAAHVRQAAWRWHDTYAWHKSSFFRGDFGTRLPDAWEPCYQFCRDPKPYIDKQANRTPITPRTVQLRRDYEARLARDGRPPGWCTDNANNSGMQPGFAHGIDSPTCQASNVLTAGTGGGAPKRGYSHPAMFPLALPTWFILLLCPPAGVVLDPFMGSGTTAVAAERLGRAWIGIERSAEYARGAEARIAADRNARLNLPREPPAGQEAIC